MVAPASRKRNSGYQTSISWYRLSTRIAIFLPVSSISSWYRAALSVDESVANGKSHQLVDAMYVELFHDAAAMGIHRVNAQVQNHRDLFVGFALRQHLKHFAFAAAQQIDRVG